MRKLLLIIMTVICVGCSTFNHSEASLSVKITPLLEKDYEMMIKNHSIENIKQEDFYEMAVSFEWSSESDLTNFQPKFVDDWASVIQSYDGASGYFLLEEAANVDYKNNRVSYITKFIFYAENSDEENLKALFQNQKFIVSRVENGKEVQDVMNVSNSIHLD